MPGARPRAEVLVDLQYVQPLCVLLGPVRAIANRAVEVASRERVRGSFDSFVAYVPDSGPRMGLRERLTVGFCALSGGNCSAPES
jgi:hypothetical protein